MILTATSKIVFGTGIANLWARHRTTKRGALTMMYNGFDHQLTNGIGISSPLIVAGSGQRYAKLIALGADHVTLQPPAASAGNALDQQE